MKQMIAEWLWRAAVVCALGWIGFELHRFHDDMMQPVEEAPTITADTEDIQRGIDDVRLDVASLAEKVDAILAIARTK